MHKKIILHVMSRKGYEVAKLAISEFKELINLIVIGQDSSIDNDYSQEIMTLAKSSEVKYCYRMDNYLIDDSCYVLAVSWRWMIKGLGEKQLIVFHDSLLPKYRGFSPLVNSLINGEEEVGVTALFGSNEYDRGDIICQSSTKISYPLKINEAININIHNYISMAGYVLKLIATNEEIISFKQDDNLATYSIWRDDLDYYIDWSKSSEEILRFINAVGHPYSGAKSYFDCNIVKVRAAEVVNDVFCELRHVGKIIFIEKGMPIVICGTGLLKLTDVTIEKNGIEEKAIPITKFRGRFT